MMNNNFEGVRLSERERLFKSISNEFNIKDVEDTDEAKAFVPSEKTVPQLLSDVVHVSNDANKQILDHANLDLVEVTRKLRILKSACVAAITKIETGW